MGPRCQGDRSRGPAAAYVPPHLRGGRPDGQTAQETPRPRTTLEEAAGSSRMTVELRYSNQQAPDLGSCPVDHREKRQDGTGHKVLEMIMPRLWQHDDAEALLEWFACAFGDDGACSAELRLPSSFSKEDRRVWHKLAESLRLHSQSEGVGESRCLSISLSPPTATQRTRSDGQSRPEISKEAKQVWAWCQDEGHGFWNFSLGEVEEMLRRQAGLPPEIRELCQHKRSAERLFGLLLRGEEAAAAQLIREARLDGGKETLQRLAWHRDPSTGAYPIHVAVRKALPEVVKLLAVMPGVLQQKDREWLDPFDVAEEMEVTELLCRLRAEADELYPSRRPLPSGHHGD